MRASVQNLVRKIPPRVRRALRRAFVPLAVVAVAICPALLAASAWVAARAEPKMYRDLSQVPARTVAIVPGAGVHPDGTPSPVLEDRLITARTLYLSGRVHRVLVSGDHAHRNYDEVNAMRRWLVAHDVPESAVFMDHAGLRTLDTMARAAQVFDVHDAVVCTQAYHLPRALFLAEGAGIDAVGAVADRRPYTHERAYRARELFALTRSLLDRYVLRTQPMYLGARISIHGPAAATFDGSERSAPR